MLETSTHKPAMRRMAREARAALFDPQVGQKLVDLFPHDPAHTLIAGFAPIGDEIDIWPLLHHLHEQGRQIVLPVVTAPAVPLIFRRWTPDTAMETDRYGVSYPAQGEPLTPTCVLVPLLAFTRGGERLGYGGGYYDRTLAELRAGLRLQSELFACGVAYAGQEVADLPTDDYDERLDGILTEKEFRTIR